MKHTQGKWKVDESTPYTISVVSPWSKEVDPRNTMTFGDYRGALICEMHYNSGVPTKEQALANAKLISTAPELLEVLIELFNLLEENEPQWYLRGHYNRAIETINKATL